MRRAPGVDSMSFSAVTTVFCSRATLPTTASASSGLGFLVGVELRPQHPHEPSQPGSPCCVVPEDVEIRLKEEPMTTWRF